MTRAQESSDVISLMMSQVPGCGPHDLQQLLKRVRRQLQGRLPDLISSDQWPAYRRTIALTWPPRRGRRSANQQRQKLTYAALCKRRRNGRVVQVSGRIIRGNVQSLQKALEESSASNTVNTSFLERHNATDRHRNARKARRTYRFSKDWEIHRAVGYFSEYTYNFCWCVRTLAQRDEQGRWRARTPAMAAGLSDHVWSLQQWLSHPAGNYST